MSHRGVVDRFPENTVEAFLEAVENGFTALELDVVASKDAELVCSHNLDLETETDGKGYFKSKSLSELVKIKTGVFTHKKILKNLSSLKEVLEKVPKSIFLNIEIKTGSIFDINSVMILEKYRKEGLLNRKYIVSTFNPFAVFFIRYFTGLRRVGFLVLYRDWLWMINYIHPDALHPSADLLDIGLIETCKKRNVKVNTWTVNNEAALKLCLKFGVDGIITDLNKPLLLQEL